MHTVISLARGHLHTVTLIPVQSRGQDRHLFFIVLLDETTAAVVD